jgi:hypothetical protein
MKFKLIAAALLAAMTLQAGDAAARFKFPNTGRVGGPGTTTPQYIMDLESASASLRRLDQDSRQLYDDQDKLIIRVQDMQEFLSTSADRLGMLSTLDADLKKLEKAVNSAYTAAEAAAAIPQAREKANKVKESLAPVKANVTAARQRVDKIVAKTEPIRKKLDSAADKAGKVRAALYVINEGAIANMRFPISIAAGCVKKTPADKRDCASRNVDDTADKVDTVVREYDRVVRLLLTKPDPWLPSLQFFNPFSTELDSIDALRKDLEALIARLENLTSGLNGIADVINQSFSFSFPYPDPKWDNPLHTSNYKVSIGFGVIIRGADAIESEIEHVLSSFLWDILKGLGVGKFVKQLQNDAERAVNYAMDKVNFGVNVDLPNMDVLAPFEAGLDKLEADIDALQFPTIDTKLPSYGFPDVDPSVNFKSIDLSVNFFNPGGLEWNNPDVCRGASYGCK